MITPEYEAKVRAFLDQPCLLSKSAYVNGSGVTCYMRINSRFIDGDVRKTIEIANVSVAPMKQGRGIYSAFLAMFIRIANESSRVVFVEGVLDYAHHQIYLRRGFALRDEVNFYKLPEKEMV